jgi:lysophospholipase L1-like esterase
MVDPIGKKSDATRLTVRRRLAVALLRSFATTVIFFVALELALRAAYLARNAMVTLVPLPYALGDQYGPIPPWLDRLLILAPDDTLIWRSLPNVRRTYVDIFSPVRTEQDRVALLRRFLPALPDQFRGNPTWHIDLNSHGDRTIEYTVAKPDRSVRIACIGDSWTFGMNVDQDQTYPSRLLARLGKRTGIEVLNFGVLGYSSFQGLQLLKTRVLALAPDILVIGFGMNDSEVAGYRDRDMIATAAPGWTSRLVDAARDFEFYKLLQYLALSIRFHPKPIAEYIREEAQAKSGTVDYETIEPWTRVSPRDYEANVREMIRLQAGHGGKSVLVDNELWDDSPYRPVLRRISADMDVPLVDSLQIIARGRVAIERELEMRFALAAHDTAPGPPALPAASAASTSTPARVSVIFRVFHGSFPVPTAMSIAGTDPALGDLKPNMVPMRDDGREGDERAGDGVWSVRASLPPGMPVFYVYTNSGARGRWEGMDVPSIRRTTIPVARRAADGPVYLPIETFGQLYMQADNWHTNAKGYELIAEAVANVLESEFTLRVSR